MKRSTFCSSSCILLLLTLASSSSLLAAKPNFSGEWKVDAAKSDFGDMPAPSSLSMEVDHADPKLVLKEFQSGGPMGEMKAELTFTTVGAETKNKVKGADLSSTAQWAGNALKLTTKMAGGVTVVETWKLSGGGRSLDILREITSAQGSSTMKLAFTKSDKK